MLRRWRESALVIALFAPLAVLLALPPIPQDPAYHALADSRSALGIPNFLNVVSNAAFLIAGGVGLVFCLRRKPAGATTSWTIFFAGAALVAFGSGYYHWMPRNESLVWDRLPMTVAFMALFAALLGEHIAPRVERVALPIAIAVGIGSVAWWSYSDDLRVYAWVQFAPLLAVALLLALFPTRYGKRSYLGYALGFYMLAKVAEYYDASIFELTHRAVSGHTVKHLLAALAPVYVYLMLRARTGSTAKPHSERAL